MALLLNPYAAGREKRRAVPPEAIEEIQILSAPFDARYGDFAGGLIKDTLVAEVHQGLTSST